jgi:hypothetical protein
MIPLSITTLDISNWAQAIRNLPTHEQRTRALDALWDTQLNSKAWLVTRLEQYSMPNAPENIYIFGGWIGTLASMLFNSTIYINKCRSIDIDPWCESIADTVNKTYEMDNWRFKATTADMATYQYQSDIRPTIVINTSTEHVTQEVYEQWLNNIPPGTLIAIQGNNFYSCPEHIRCQQSLEQFNRDNLVPTNPYWTGQLVLPQYTRYMTIWRK